MGHTTLLDCLFEFSNSTKGTDYERKPRILAYPLNQNPYH